MVALPLVKVGENCTNIKFVYEVFNNIGSFHELIWYPEVHAGSGHVRFKFLLVYNIERRFRLNEQG